MKQASHIEERDYAIFLLKKNRADIVWSGMVTLENNPASLPATQTILEGYGVSGLTISEQMQIKNFGNGVDTLVNLLKSKKFIFTKEIACLLHNVIGEDEDLTFGKLRDSPACAKCMNYVSIDAGQLDRQWIETERDINSLINGGKLSLASAEAFCRIARFRFFGGCNKRIGWLMAIGILVNASIPPYAFDVQGKERFNTVLSKFYRSGNSNELVNLLCEYGGFDISKFERKIIHKS